MLREPLLGRYEYHNDAKNSHKFYEMIPALDALGAHRRNSQGEFLYEARWGRIGSKPQPPKIYTETEASEKLVEKRGKAYEKVKSLSEMEADGSVNNKKSGGGGRLTLAERIREKSQSAKSELV